MWEYRARVKRVTLIENGIPVAWEVVRGYELKPVNEREQIKQTKQGVPLNLKREDNITKEYLDDVLDAPLKVGDLNWNTISLPKHTKGTKIRSIYFIKIIYSH